MTAIASAGILTRKQLMEELSIKDTETIREWEKEGLPTIRRGNMVFYHVPSIVKWLLKHQLKKAS